MVSRVWLVAGGMVFGAVVLVGCGSDVSPATGDTSEPVVAVGTGGSCTVGDRMCDPDNTPSGICVCRTDGNGGGYWACGTFGTRCASGLVCEDNNNGTVSCVDPLDPSLSESIAPSPVETIQLVATP